MQRLISLLLIVLFGTHTTFAQTSVAIGAQIPKIEITDWIENVPEDTLLEGKIVVVDFWATWCGPCIKAVPHFNELKAAFEDRSDILFISMTDESPEKAKRILERIDFQSAVVSDQSGNTQKRFGIQAIPYTLIINRENTLVWSGYPEDLDEGLIQKVINNEDLETSEGEKAANKMAYQKVAETNNAGLKELMGLRKDTSMKSLFKIIPSTQEAGMTLNMLPVLFYRAGSDIVNAVAFLMDIPEYRIETAPEVSESNFNISYIDKKAKIESEVKSFMLTSILDMYHLSLSEESKSVEVMLVKVSDSTKLKPSGGQQGSLSDAGDKTIYTNQPMESVLFSLESKLSIPILDRTKLSGTFDFILENTSKEAVIESLASYGLSVEIVKQEMPFFKIAVN